SSPADEGACAVHQRTSRISRLGSASGSQVGQYRRETEGLSGMCSVTALWRKLSSPSSCTLATHEFRAKFLLRRAGVNMKPSDDIERQVLDAVGQAMGRFGMLRPGDRVAVGVSGGKDSLCLL